MTLPTSIKRFAFLLLTLVTTSSYVFCATHADAAGLYEDVQQDLCDNCWTTAAAPVLTPLTTATCATIGGLCIVKFVIADILCACLESCDSTGDARTYLSKREHHSADASKTCTSFGESVRYTAIGTCSTLCLPIRMANTCYKTPILLAEFKKMKNLLLELDTNGSALEPSSLIQELHASIAPTDETSPTLSYVDFLNILVKINFAIEVETNVSKTRIPAFITFSSLKKLVQEKSGKIEQNDLLPHLLFAGKYDQLTDKYSFYVRRKVATAIHQQPRPLRSSADAAYVQEVGKRLAPESEGGNAGACCLQLAIRDLLIP